MILSSEAYILQYANYSYEDLIVVRDELIEDIKEYETGNIHPKAYSTKPGPEEIYQRNLEYLVEITKLILRKLKLLKVAESKKNKDITVAVETTKDIIRSPKEDLEEDSILYKALQIQKLLSQYNIESEVRDDRKGGPYINIGEVSSVKDRVQFWCNKRTNGVKCWVGKNMRPWSSVAFSSEFRKKWRYEDSEYYLAFDKLYELDEFIRVVSKFEQNINTFKNKDRLKSGDDYL